MAKWSMHIPKNQDNLGMPFLRYYKLVVLGTLAMPGHTSQK